MTKILYNYHLDSTTWVYLSSLLVLTAYFRFSPLLRLRNLDVLGFVAMAPALVLMEVSRSGVPLARTAEYWAYLWLFGVGLFFLIRMIADPYLVRRPLLEPNLNTGGLTFLGSALLLFLSVRMIVDQLPPGAEAGFERMFSGLPGLLVSAVSSEGKNALGPMTRGVGVFSQVMLAVGLVLVGYRHYRNFNMGVSVATLYLMLPCTAVYSGRPEMTLPAALLVWMTLLYRSPFFAGSLLGLATAAISYPLFLAPLWCGFYWTRGMWRFLSGFVGTLAAFVLVLAVTPAGVSPFLGSIQSMFGWSAAELAAAQGLWGIIFEPAYRIPTQVAFFALCIGLTIWPVRKNLGTVLAGSAAVMIGCQFWQLQGGGMSFEWYLPLLLLTVFRPNLEDRVALDAWDSPRHRIGVWPGQRAA